VLQAGDSYSGGYSLSDDVHGWILFGDGGVTLSSTDPTVLKVLQASKRDGCSTRQDLSRAFTLVALARGTTTLVAVTKSRQYVFTFAVQ